MHGELATQGRQGGRDRDDRGRNKPAHRRRHVHLRAKADRYRRQPPCGLQSGGTPVTISGTHFNVAQEVAFGPTPAQIFTVASQTAITAVAPPGVAGTANVAVTAPGGTSETTGADRFTYVPAGPAPAISKLSAKKGPAVGGTYVNIAGTGFSCVGAVRFGSETASSYTVNGPTSITAVAPPGTSARPQ